jgi:DNA-binding SARP family transcriptional activator/tetratricopeptide (TPR) repeat protein/type II secretory pathway predicted ATPase ExeA
MEPQRYLRCLGQPALFTAAGEPIRFRTRKHLALLVYIAVEERVHRRDRLAELLWPRVSAMEARHSLATALSILRPRLGLEALETSRDQVRLVPGRVVLDLARLRSGDVLGNDVSGPLEVAAFLDGFEINDSAEFTHWKDGQQARLLPIIKDALLVLMDRCRRTGDTRQIEQLADRMLELDELSEEAIRAKMEARAFAGDRLTALEIFEGWKKKLAEELQAAPSDLVEGMAVRLRRRGWERTTLSNIPNVPTDQWRNRPFVGRTAEYQRLYEIWEGVRRGVAGHALVLGDSGVGKTTLVQRLTTAAGLEGAVISRVQAYDLEREIPYATLSGLVLGLLNRPGASATSPEALAELSRTVPEVRYRFQNIPNPVQSQGEAARIRLTEAFLQMLSAITEEHPVVLVLDDLHCADDVSLAVLHLIIRRAQNKPLMFILIAREGELTRSPQAIRLREGAASLNIRDIDLAPLVEEHSREMLRSLVEPDGYHPNAAEQRALLSASAGYPMVLELLVQDWKVNREQSLALGMDAMTSELATEGSAHLAYRRIMDRITTSLDSTTRNVLNLASILGPRLNELGMYALVDLSAGHTMTAMTYLVERRVLRDGAQGLEFVNELVRASAYLGVPQSLRRVLHGNIADRFIEQHGIGNDDLGLEVAWHCIRAGRTCEARSYLLSGARNAIRSGAPAEAERGLSTALPQLDAGSRTEALVLLSEALQEQGKWAESILVLDQVATDSTDGALDTAFILRTKAQRRLGLIHLQDLAVLPAELLQFMRSTHDPVNRIRAAVEAASILEGFRSNSFIPEILESVDQIELQALGLDDTAHLFLAKAMLRYQLKDLKQSLEWASKGLELLERNKHTSSVLGMLQNGLGSILSRQGLYEQSVPEYLKCYQTAARVGNDRIYVQASANLSLSLMRLGDYDEAITWGERSLSGCDVLKNLGFGFQGAQGTVMSYAMTGRNGSKADELLSAVRADLATRAPLGVSQGWALYSADSYAIMGRGHDAEQEGRRGTQGVNEQLQMDFFAGPYARWVARTAVANGDVAAAYRKIDVLLARLGSYDAVDQADILNARCWLDSKMSRFLSEQSQAMQRRLHTLPRAVSEQLRRIGMMDFC